MCGANGIINLSKVSAFNPSGVSRHKQDDGRTFLNLIPNTTQVVGGCFPGPVAPMSRMALSFVVDSVRLIPEFCFAVRFESGL